MACHMVRKFDDLHNRFNLMSVLDRLTADRHRRTERLEVTYQYRVSVC